MKNSDNLVLTILLIVIVFILPRFFVWLYGGGFTSWCKRHLTKPVV